MGYASFLYRWSVKPTRQNLLVPVSIFYLSFSNSSLSAFQTEGARGCGRSAGTLASVRASSWSSDAARQFPPPHHSVINSPNAAATRRASARPSAAVIDERTFSSPTSLFALACQVKWCVSASQSPFISVYGVEPLPVSPISTHRFRFRYRRENGRTSLPNVWRNGLEVLFVSV